MFTVISFMFAGIVVGYFMRKVAWVKHVSLTISITIYLLLFFIGMSVGANDSIVGNLTLLGGEALFVSLMGTAGSILAAWFVYRLFFKGTEERDER